MARFNVPAIHYSWHTEQRRQTEAERHMRAKRESLLRQMARRGESPPRPVETRVLSRGRAPVGCLAPYEVPELS